MKLSFMTWVCPGWDQQRIVKFAKEAGYDGVEFRVDCDQKHDISSRSTADERRRCRKLFKDAGVEIPCIATSIQMAAPEPEKHREHLAAARANLDLAADLGAPIVRIFAGGGRTELTSEAAEQVAAAFDEVGEYAKARGVCPMLECGHDIIKGAAESDEVLKRVKTSNFCALWNYSEMDDSTFAVLKGRIRHLHVHDEVLDPANSNILTLARRMRTINYKGYVSLEIIKGEDLPEDLLRATATRLNGFIAQAYGGK